MDQVNLAFVPDVLVIPVHSTVQFPNSDAVSHQVYSFSSARQFQLPLYRGKPYPPVQFDQPGVVTLGCNIHDNMLALHRGDGRAVLRPHRRAWRMERAPTCRAARYRVRVWHPLLNEPGDVERVVEVGARANARRVQADEGAAPRAPHRPAALMGLLSATPRSPRGCAARRPCACSLRARGAGRATGSSSLDLRAVSSDGRKSFLDNGHGKLRFDDDHEGIQLGRLRAAWNQPLGRSVRRARRGVRLGRRRQESHRSHRSLPRVPALPARRLALARAARRLLSTHVARESRARLGDAIHHHAFGDQFLDRRGDSAPSASRASSTGWARARATTSISSSPARCSAGTIRPAPCSPTTASRCTIARPPCSAASAHRSPIRHAPRKSCSTRSTVARATTSARRRATSIAPCSTSCTTTIAPIRPCEAPEIARHRVEDALRCRGAAHRDRQRLDPAAAGHRRRHRHQSVPCC